MERNITIDVLRIVLAFMVIGKHTNFMHETNPVLGYFLNDGLFRTAVPLFITISGYYFSSFVKHKGFFSWLKRYVFIYIFWMSIYSNFWISLSNVIFFNLIIGVKHLWYMPGLIGAGIVMYLLRKIKTKFILMIAIFLYLIGLFIQYTGNYHIFRGNIVDEYFNYNWVHKNFLFYCFPFFAVGHLLDKKNLNTILSKKISLLLFLTGNLCFSAECLINYILTNGNESFANMFTLLFFAPSVFIFSMKIRINGKSKILSEFSSSIYFIHYWIIFLLQNIFSAHGVILTFLTSILSAVLSYFIIQLNRKILIKII